MHTRARPRSSAGKVELSFANWVLGGSLISVSPMGSEFEFERQRRRSTGRSRTIVEVDSVCRLLLFHCISFMFLSMRLVEEVDGTTLYERGRIVAN